MASKTLPPSREALVASIADLARQLTDMTDDYMRLHKDAVYAFKRIAILQHQLAEATAEIVRLRKGEGTNG